ncbi:oligosaccharide flippase family protein [Empedobacter sp.]|uniref:oligosaccharide flippase family protein n=1 Tax=Empedobacter sp. TaxID=1927715 RepID=UPI0028A7EC64|nr:oligosaccharide flippase family protein [Empedobacter sp.]
MEQSNLIKLISNYGSKLWSMISVFIFIPLYIKFLGSENYGLIGFYALLLGIISFADSGMSSAVIKEFSQESNSNYKYTVFCNLEKIYLFVCILICTIIFFSTGFIVDHWISSKGIPRNELIFNVRLIGIGVTTQLISSLYFGALFALNNQVRSNLIQLLWSFSRSALVFVLFVLFSKSIEIYFFWQILCNILYVLVLRYFVVKKLKEQNENQVLKIEFSSLPKHITSYIGGMVFIAIISAINIQADKLVTSSMFDLGTFGFYNIASSLAQLPAILAAPVIAFAFPLFSKFSSADSIENDEKNLNVFSKVFYLINIMVVIIAVAVFFYAKEILLLWTKNTIPDLIFPAITFDVKVLIIGSLFLSLQFPLYYLLLSKGKTKYTIYQGIVQVCIGIPLLYYCSKRYGLYGIPIPWLTINLLAFIYLFIIVSKYYLNFATISFYQKIFISPIIITLVVNILMYFCYKQFTINFIPFVAIASVLSLISSIVFYNFQNNYNLLSFKHIYNFPHE